jgi:hypothetical protein
MGREGSPHEHGRQAELRAPRLPAAPPPGLSWLSAPPPPPPLRRAAKHHSHRSPRGGRRHSPWRHQPVRRGTTVTAHEHGACVCLPAAQAHLRAVAGGDCVPPAPAGSALLRARRVYRTHLQDNDLGVPRLRAGGAMPTPDRPLVTPISTGVGGAAISPNAAARLLASASRYLPPPGRTGRPPRAGAQACRLASHALEESRPFPACGAGPPLPRSCGAGGHASPLVVQASLLACSPRAGIAACLYQ